ncbi:MAG: hypothetical protein V1729_01995 [Candidatus Woesearchaeota archaeon]
MAYKIGIQDRVIDVFEQALDHSITTGVEHFGLCLFDRDNMRLVDAMPHGCTYHQSDDKGKDFVRPGKLLMRQVSYFNKGIVGKINLIEQKNREIKTYSFDRSEGSIVLYHTHPDEEQDFFSSIGAAGDTDFSFVEHDLPLDIVISANARSRNMRPPVCVTMNKDYFPFDPEQGYAGMSMKDLMKLDRRKNVHEGTHPLLAAQESSRKEHMTIDFIVEQ